MEEQKKYIQLYELKVYQIARELSSKGWEIYGKFSFEQKKLFGDQFLRAIDSIGANIAEGYARYHALDQVRFYHIARASMSEAISHWSSLLLERKVITEADYLFLSEKSKELEIKLNNFISTTRKSVEK
jgi:four helix bundle protein